MEVLKVNDTNDNISYSVKLNFMNDHISNVVKTTLEVDPEYSKNINREINVTNEGSLEIKYHTQAIYLKPMKKSINAMFENMALVLQTIRDFAPDN